MQFNLDIKKRELTLESKSNYFIKEFTIVCLLTLLFATQGLSQTTVKLRATLSSGGLSKTVSINGNDCYMQQCIGQLSIIGFIHTNTISIRQGFIQPLIAGSSTSKKTDSSCLQAIIYPNPFSKSITITFSNKITECIYVDIKDLFGRTLLSNRYGAIQELSIDFPDLKPGMYIIKVVAGEKQLTTRLIKE